jgi:hypothetical protein
MSQSFSGVLILLQVDILESDIAQSDTYSLPGIRNDVGIIIRKESGERFILSCFTMEADDVYDAEDCIARVSENVYKYFYE